MNGLVTVPISAHASSSHLLNVLTKTSLRVLVVDANLLSTVLNTASSSLLKHVIVIGDVSDLHKKEAQISGIELLTFGELEKRGDNEKYEGVQVGRKRKGNGNFITY